MLKRIIFIGLVFSSYSTFAYYKLPSFFGEQPTSIEAYIGLGLGYNKNSYSKSNYYNFMSSGAACAGNPCGAQITDPLLVTADSINYSKSNHKSNFNLVPTFGIKFNFDRFNFSLESSYFFNNFSRNSSAENWKTLPNNPNGIGGNPNPNTGDPFSINPMGETINASLNEKIGDIFSLSILPGYKFTDWLSGFFKVGWATTKFTSNSKWGTNGGAGYLGISGNYSKRLHGILFGLGMETEYHGYNFRLEYNRIQFSGFNKTSTELGSTANNSKSVYSSDFDLYTEGNINFQGQTKTKYKKFTSDILMLSVIKKFNILGDG